MDGVTLSDEAWEDVNRCYLAAAVGEVRSLVERFVATPGAAPAGSAQATQDTAAPVRQATEVSDLASQPALERLCRTFLLSRFERLVLLLCAGVELDAGLAAICAQLDPSGFPNFGLALGALPEPHWSAVTPAGMLRQWHLVEFVPQAGKPLVATPLRIDERVLHCLTGIQYIDDRIVGTAEPVVPQELVASQRDLAHSIGRIADGATSTGMLPQAVVQLCGGDDQTRRAVAAAVAESLGFGLIAVHAENLPASPSELELALRLCEREAVLSVSALCLCVDAIDRSDHYRVAQITRLLERMNGLVFLLSLDRWRPLRRPVHSYDIHKPSALEQASLWQSLLNEAGASGNAVVNDLTAQFNLNRNEIHASVQQALAAETDGGGLATRLWDAGRSQARPRLDDLAQRLEPQAGWDDLILPEAEKATLAEIASHVAHRRVVYQDWGFANTGNRGLGISALFAGASGTGKTMAADVLAHELRLDLYRIDLSSVVSKYIGETEKNLRRVFDAAEDGGAILFFDEADALFGKRTEVKDSHDRYANVEINYLLQRMECYTGLSILATNMKASLDQAFLRRLRFVLNFPFPDSSARVEMWQKAFPTATPTAKLDIAALARLNVSGGNIRNIAMNAAFLAARENQAIRMQHIVRAARTEYAKMERPLTELDLRGLQ